MAIDFSAIPEFGFMERIKKAGVIERVTCSLGFSSIDSLFHLPDIIDLIRAAFEYPVSLGLGGNTPTLSNGQGSNFQSFGKENDVLSLLCETYVGTGYPARRNALL
jgi:hypothetical protein